MQKFTLAKFLISSILVFNVNLLFSADTVINVNNAGEPSLVTNTSFGTSILNSLYGAGNYTRISDSIDQIWSLTNGNASAVAKYAGNASVFGYYTGTNGLLNFSTFNALFAVTGSGYTVAGSASNLNLSDIRFGLQSGGNYFSSQASDNNVLIPSGQDMMVTFLITGNSGGFTNNTIGNYVIAWEDSSSAISDRDFNDAVIEIANAVPAPEPTTMLVMGTFLTMIYAARRKSLKSV